MAGRRLRPFFSYFGAKYNLAPKYPAPRYDTVIEWYAGSAQYATLHHDRDVVLIEAYAPVAELWRYLIKATEREILAIPDLPDGATVRDLGLPPGPSFLIGFWLQMATATPAQSMTAACRVSSKGELHWGPRVRARVAEQLPAIRHRTVVEGRCDEFDLGRAAHTHFVDPPYVKAGGRYGVSGVDYVDLARRCKTARGQVIVCEAEGAGWLPFEPLAEISARPQNGARTSKEMIWTNGRA